MVTSVLPSVDFPSPDLTLLVDHVSREDGGRPSQIFRSLYSNVIMFAEESEANNSFGCIPIDMPSLHCVTVTITIRYELKGSLYEAVIPSHVIKHIPDQRGTSPEILLRW